MLIVVFFIIGYLLFTLLKKEDKYKNNKIENNTNKLDYDILEALEYSKQSQINYLNSKINEIYTKLEIIESQLNQSRYYSKNIAEKGSDDSDNSPNHNISHNITLSDITERKNHNPGKTIPVILNFLSEPKTSTEIKNTIGKTREHTSRLMKKLYDLNLVERDNSNKPFKYKLTESGKKFLSNPNKELDNITL